MYNTCYWKYLNFFFCISWISRHKSASFSIYLFRFSAYINFSFPLFSFHIHHYINYPLVLQFSSLTVFSSRVTIIYHQHSLPNTVSFKTIILFPPMLHLLPTFSYRWYSQSIPIILVFLLLHVSPFRFGSGGSFLIVSFHDLLSSVFEEVFFKTRSEVLLLWKPFFTYMYSE